MHWKKLLALLLSAALALSVFAACGNGESAVQVLLNLLDGKYPNISIEIDPDLEADLRQAISTAEAESENETDDEAAIRAALETLLGSNITFRYLGEGQKGDTAFDLIFYAGSDPDKAAQAAYNQWNLVFSNVPADGQYGTSLAMVETNSGVWMLVKATVEKAGTVDKPDKDDEESSEPQDEVITNVGFEYNVNKDTITVEPDTAGIHSLENLFLGTTGESDNANHDLADARADGFQGINITLKPGTYTVSQTFNSIDKPFMGTLKGEGNGTTITLEGKSLFVQIGREDGDEGNNGAVQNINFIVNGQIINTCIFPTSRSGLVCTGAVAGNNHGEISGCAITINGTITSDCTNTSWSDYDPYAGGITGYNTGIITDCTVDGGTITATTGNVYGSIMACVGGMVGYNSYYGTIGGTCIVKNGTTIKATGMAQYNEARAGGIAGCNVSRVGTDGGVCKVEGIGSILTTTSTSHSLAGGIIGWNGHNATVAGDFNWSGTQIQAVSNGYTATVPDKNNQDQDDDEGTDQVYVCAAGTEIGDDDGWGPVSIKPAHNTDE